MTGPPLVSIITPAYNAARFIEATIRSVQEQDYPCIEHIVIDDGSTDDGATVAVLRQFPHLRWWSRPNRGQYATMNEGLAAARGDLIGLISADDVYTVPRSISRVVAYAAAHPHIDAIYGRWLDIDQSGAVMPVQVRLTGRYPLRLFRYVPFISHCALFVRRAIIERDGLLFDETMRYAGDADWIQRLIAAGTRFGFLDAYLAGYRWHGGQTTGGPKQAAILAEHRRFYRRWHADPRLAAAAESAIIMRSLILKAMYTVRAGGVRGLRRETRAWQRRRSMRARARSADRASQQAT
jgi:glycosyltransferase involved in cell wall biosynthesis